jgi:hypothetical protein
MRADSLNPDPTRLGFRNSAKTWLAGPPKQPVGSNTVNGSELRVATCPEGGVLSGLMVRIWGGRAGGQGNIQRCGAS